MEEKHVDLIENIAGSTPSQAMRLGPLNRGSRRLARRSGTFLPLWLGMVTICCLDPSTSLIVAGAANMASGLAFGIPMSIQPLNTITAVAITSSFSRGDLAAASFSVGLTILILTLVRGFNRIHHWIPAPVVRGIQSAVMLELAMAGAHMLLIAPGQLRPWMGSEGLWWAAAGVGALWIFRRNRRLPGRGRVIDRPARSGLDPHGPGTRRVRPHPPASPGRAHTGRMAHGADPWWRPGEHPELRHCSLRPGVVAFSRTQPARHASLGGFRRGLDEPDRRSLGRHADVPQFLLTTPPNTVSVDVQEPAWS